MKNNYMNLGHDETIKYFCEKIINFNKTIILHYLPISLSLTLVVR